MSEYVEDYFTESYQTGLTGQLGGGHGAHHPPQQQQQQPQQYAANGDGGLPYNFYGLEDYLGGNEMHRLLSGWPHPVAATPPGGQPPPQRLQLPGRPSPMISAEGQSHSTGGLPPPQPQRVPSRSGGQGPTYDPLGSTAGSSNSLLQHCHTDTYETPLPAEALGAKQLVDYLFHPDAQPGAYSNLSPSNVSMRAKPEEVGLPLPLASEPVNPHTGRRLVYLGRGQLPIPVKAEPKNRFIAVTFKPLLVNEEAQHPQRLSETHTTSYGTVLGYSDDNTQIIWHERSERFASRVSLSDILMIHRSSAMQCKHCGLVLLRPELREHMSTHKKGSGVEYGVFTDDAALGMVCGDTGLIQSMVRPKKLGEGAQGVVELCEITQPTAQEEARAGPDSFAYRHQSRHLAGTGRLTKAVMKTMRFDSGKEAWAQYQKSVRFMTVMENPHLVEYLAVQLLPDHRTLKLAMPYYAEGDLATAIRDCRGTRFEEPFICSVALQLSLALTFLHERNPPIVHGDIKVENVMFYNGKEQVVLMDLDASCEVRLTERSIRTAIGTAAYMAPETMNNERLMPASDMWSLGVLLYVLAVMPQFPMITDPVTMEEVMMNAPSWASPEDQRAINEFLVDTNSALARAPQRRLSEDAATRGRRGGDSRVSLGDCVRANVCRRGYSQQLTQLVVDLLSYNPWKRPTAAEVGERLTEIMMDRLLHT